MQFPGFAIAEKWDYDSPVLTAAAKTGSITRILEWATDQEILCDGCFSFSVGVETLLEKQLSKSVRQGPSAGAPEPSQEHHSTSSGPIHYVDADAA